jgi:hypothetical protein
MPFLMSFALELEIMTLAWIDNASVQFPLNIYATKGLTGRKEAQKAQKFSRLFCAICAFLWRFICSLRPWFRISRPQALAEQPARSCLPFLRFAAWNRRRQMP